MQSRRNSFEWITIIRQGHLSYDITKRFLDLVISLFALFFTLPISLAVALAVVSSSKGGAIYKSQRIGLQGRPFTVYKFRSMYDRADHHYSKVRENLEFRNGPFYKRPDDPRVTPVGKLIRRLSLDEIPQFWNVLMGQMSLVGPRPSLRLEIAEMGSHGEERLRVKPGITGLCQISGRANLPYERCVELERLYIEHASIRLDLWILWKTLSVAVRKVGAH